jgi:Baseplate J-like protein
MPLQVPRLDDRRYQDLLDEALARVAIHNPEWTNFQPSDPGVTILESFAFLVEALLYRVNRIPERDRAKFLSLLGIPLAPARAARTLVAFSMKDDAPPVTLGGGMTLMAGNVPFFTEAALDVLPGEARAVVKRVAVLDDARVAEYRAVYATLRAANPGSELVFYEPAPLPSGGLDLAETADRAVWLALLVPEKVIPKTARASWAGKTLGLGLAPLVAARPTRDLPAGGAVARVAGLSGGWEVAIATAEEGLTFRTLRTIGAAELRDEPAAYEIPLPADLKDLEPPNPTDAFDEGSGPFPPKLDAAKDRDRLAVWLRLRPEGSAFAGVQWAGINAVAARQSHPIRSELVGIGTGEPDQEVLLAHGPVAPGSIKVRVRTNATALDAHWDEWVEIDDLLAAGPQTPGNTPDANASAPSRAFQSDPEARTIRFGDGLRGARPGLDLPIRADYEVCVGRAGNVGAAQLKASADIPAQLDATNPLPAWGGGDAQTPDDAEVLIPRAVRHRDRLVTAEDYRDLALAAPGAGVGRVEVLPLFAPALSDSLPGDVAGAVTLLLVPRDDPARPDAPTPTSAFLDAVCSYLDSKRPVTAEVYLRGPEYVSLTVSVGFEVQPGFAVPDVRDRLASAVRAFLAPLPLDAADAMHPDGWPLEKPVNSRELLAVASRVRGVRLMTGAEIAADGIAAVDGEIRLRGLQLPRIDRLSVAAGTPVPIASLRGQAAPPKDGPKPLPVPVIPREC